MDFLKQKHFVILSQTIGCFMGLWMSVVLASNFNTKYPDPQMQGLHDWKVTPVFTIGETLPSLTNPGGYTPVGNLDGIGAATHDSRTIRLFINHELHRDKGYPYTLRNGTQLTGARVSFVNLDRLSKKIVDSGLAYHTIFDRQFQEVLNSTQINEMGRTLEGLHSLCSGQLVEEHRYNFQDTIFFTHEEAKDPNVHPYGGTLWALNIQRGELHAVPTAGRLTWENTAALEAPNGKVALLIGDDTDPAPLWLYLGKKDASIFEIKPALPHVVSPPQDNFLNRNGLLVGDLYYFAPEDGLTDPRTFHGTGNQMKGIWKKISVLDESMAGYPGYDPFGYKNGETLRNEAFHGGAFKFLRPEDVSTNPNNPHQAVLTTTGQGQLFNGANDWGTTYLVKVNFLNMSADLQILYDGDNPKEGQVPHSDFGLRSPDNVEWGRDGYLYIQEDPATRVHTFGNQSGREASIWRIHPQTGESLRIAEMDRTVVVPKGVSDPDSTSFGKWESSGILDVTNFFELQGNWTSTNVQETKRLLIGTVQAHSLKDGVIREKNLFQGGQLIFLKEPAD